MKLLNPRPNNQAVPMPKATAFLSRDGNGIRGNITLLDPELIKKHGKSESIDIPYGTEFRNYENLREEAIRRMKERYSLEEGELEVMWL